MRLLPVIVSLISAIREIGRISRRDLIVADGENLKMAADGLALLRTVG